MPTFEVPEKPWDVGFTGSQDGMTDEQKDMFINVILTLRPATFHHGVCVGADEDAHFLVRRYLPETKIIGYPGTKNDGRVWKRSRKAETDLDQKNLSKPFLDRNDDIVKEVDFLIATPKEFEEQQRSGTWSTVRRARWAKTFVILAIFPDGTMGIEYGDSSS